jgi:hypothetical protein
MRAIAMLVLAAAACGGGKDPGVCRREAHELGELLATIGQDMPAFYAGDATLVTRADIPPVWPGYGPMIVLTADEATYNGEPFDSREAADRLASEREVAHMRAAGGRPVDDELVVLVIDEAARWADVARIAQTLHERGFRRPALAFARPPSPVTRPPRSKIDDELDAIIASDDASNKATRFAKLVEKVIKGCPPLGKAFGAVAAVDGESKAETIIRAIEPSLVKCNCNVDMPSFSSAMFRLLYVEKPQSFLRITLDPTATPLVLPPETLWRDANAKLTPDARVWIPLP